MLVFLLTAIVVLGLPTLYLAYRSREVRKFLAGSFFVGAGTQFYLYLAKVSVPVLGTSLVFTPRISALNSAFYFLLALLVLWLYHGTKGATVISRVRFVIKAEASRCGDATQVIADSLAFVCRSARSSTRPPRIT